MANSGVEDKTTIREREWRGRAKIEGGGGGRGRVGSVISEKSEDERWISMAVLGFSCAFKFNGKRSLNATRAT